MSEVVPRESLQERVTFATLGPMARLAVRFQLPLKRVKQLTELAYYQETRRKGLKMAQIQEVMSIGFSKVGTLSRQLKDYHAMLGSDFGIQRRILLLLWAVPLTQKHLVGAFPDVEPEQVVEVLGQMVAQGTLEIVDGRTERYALVANHNQLLQDHWYSRLNALGSLMANAVQVVEARFFDGRDEAFVRTLNFRVRASDVPKLQAFYKEHLFPLIEELDGAVGQDEPSVPIKLSFMWVQDEDTENDHARTGPNAGKDTDGTA